jgi:hypothetical protein
MALTQKPRVGERLRTSTGKQFWVHNFDGDICYTRDGAGRESCFIWRFVRTGPKGAPVEYEFNTEFTHAPENAGEKG